MDRMMQFDVHSHKGPHSGWVFFFSYFENRLACQEAYETWKWRLVCLQARTSGNYYADNFANSVFVHHAAHHTAWR